MATVKKNIKKAQTGDNLTIKKANVYKENKAVLDSAQKKNLSVLDEQMTSNKQKAIQAKPKKAFKKGGTVAKEGKWIQAATKSIKKRGTEGVCTGSKFGGPTCKPGSKRYNLAKTFRKMAKSRKGK